MKVRASWLIVLAVLAATVAARPLREQVRGLATSEVVYRQLVAPSMVRPQEDPLLPYQRQALPFVEQHCPDDPDMLVAAARLSPNAELAASRLWRAIQRKPDPAFYAAYASLLMRAGPRFSRIGQIVTDPADQAQLAAARLHLRRSELPDRVTPSSAAAVLQVLHDWQSADPKNGVPLALEAYYLYGLHRDREAMQQWERAGRLPEACDYRWQLSLLSARLLNRMGMTESDAAVCTVRALPAWPAGSLTTMAHYVSYEGLLARQQGRGDDARRWWQGTVGLAQHVQDSSDTAAAYNLGLSLEEIGTAPAWQLYWPTRPVPADDFGARGAKLYYGAAHDLYARREGAKGDAQVRDRLLATMARAALLNKQPGALRSAAILRQAFDFQRLGRVALRLSGWCLAIFLLAGLPARRAVDAAASRGRFWPLLTGWLAPALALTAAAWAMRVSPGGLGERTLAGQISRTGFLSAVVAAVCVPLFRATCWRPPHAELTLIWRGNLRRALPLSLALCALLYLGLSLAAARVRADWLHTWTRPGATEMSVLIGRLGPQWDRPPVRPDSWCAGRPEIRRAPGTWPPIGAHALRGGAGMMRRVEP